MEKPDKPVIAILGLTIGWVILLIIILSIAFIPAFIKADPRMETRDGFCHFQIDPEDDDVEVFAAVCQSSIYVYYTNEPSMAEGDAIWVKKYNRGRTPIGDVDQVKREQQDHNTAHGDTGEPGEFIMEPCFNLMGENGYCHLKRVRLTGETSDYECTLVDSNGTTYDTYFWTAVYDLYSDGTVKYTLECRNAVD